MTARVPEPCDVPGEHEGPVRFFVTGWKCRAHAPQSPTTNRNGGALPDPPRPQSQWGRLPARLQDAGIIRHYSAGPSARCRQSLVCVWIGVPARLREAVARRRREERAARREARAAERRAA